MQLFNDSGKFFNDFEAHATLKARSPNFKRVLGARKSETLWPNARQFHEMGRRDRLQDPYTLMGDCLRTVNSFGIQPGQLRYILPGR